jgi:hypothetical protein
MGTETVELRSTGSSGIHRTLNWMSENLTDKAICLHPFCLVDEKGHRK